MHILRGSVLVIAVSAASLALGETPQVAKQAPHRVAIKAHE